MLNLLARVAGALALASFYAHVGMHLALLERGVGALAWTAFGLFLLLSVAATWAQARLNAKRAAVWTALVTLGLLPVGAFLVHLGDLDRGNGYGPVLVLNLLFGALTIVFSGMILAQTRGPGGAAAGRDG